MKLHLRLGPGGKLDPQTAWLCCTTNLVCPGSGSLMAGRSIGYAQLAVTFVGFGLTTWFGGELMVWAARHWSELMSAANDPIDMLVGMWRIGRWAILGMILFGIACLWALMTSLAVLRLSKTPAKTSPVPPIIREQR